MIKLSIIVSILLLGTASVLAQDPPKCGVCQSGNEALCVTETSYYLCFGGSKYGNEIQCPQGEVCSNTESICAPKTPDVVNVCGGSTADSCGICATNKIFTCVGPTRAGRCISGFIDSAIDCKADEICVAEAEDLNVPVCVPQCVADYMKVNATCADDIGFTKPTPSQPPTRAPPTATERLQICLTAASKQLNKNFFYTHADSTCINAIFCQRSSPTSTNWQALYRTCPSATPYFDLSTKDCVKNKPSSCTTNE